MEPVENILKEYRNADAECRLDLFLEHRDLRDRFNSIEEDEEKGRSTRRSGVEAPREPGSNNFMSPL